MLPRFFSNTLKIFDCFVLPVGPPFCSYHLPVVASDCCLAVSWGGNNLFGKDGPKLGLSVGLVVFLKVGLNM